MEVAPHLKLGMRRMGRTTSSFLGSDQIEQIRNPYSQLPEARGSYFGGKPAQLVTVDERDRGNWSTQYRTQHGGNLPHVYAQKKRHSEQGVYAGEITSHTGMDWDTAKNTHKKDIHKHAQREYYASTLDLSHASGVEEDDRFLQTSNLIGNAMRPKYLADGSLIPQPGHYRNQHRKQSRIPAGNNDRNLWNRNTSRIGPTVFRAKLDTRGVLNPRNEFGPNAIQRNRHFTTMKGQLDDQTIRKAWDEGSYVEPDTYTSQRTVSVDAPTWFQVPGVNISKLNGPQLKSLMEWNAPVPQSSLSETVMSSLAGSHDRVNMFAKHANCPLYCNHQGCEQAKLMLGSQQCRGGPQRSKSSRGQLYSTSPAPQQHYLRENNTTGGYLGSRGSSARFTETPSRYASPYSELSY